MIKNAFFSLLIFASASLFTNAWANNSILLLGDSLSASYGMKQNQGWVHLVNESLTEQNSSINIVNASISGETTSGGLARLPAVLEENYADILLIELGGNDGLRGHPPATIKNNLLQIIALAKAKDIEVWLMEISIPPNYGARYNKMFNQVFKDVAEEENVTLLPFFMEEIAIDKSLMQNDGIHPNIAAQPRIAEIMSAKIQALITSG